MYAIILAIRTSFAAFAGVAGGAVAEVAMLVVDAASAV